ncbi:MAG: dienelactone hydrolase family protein [Proteobacteria bacterium]|nr:dienelactone hydrolase family protein [Pseudomonadota bacterium]
MSGDMKLVSAADGFALGAYHVEAQVQDEETQRRGGLVLLQEIFGVNANIRALADSFAADGFEVVAPSVFDRIEPGFQAGYDEDGFQKGLATAGATNWDVATGDIQAAIDWLNGPVFVAGFCWGGTAAWLAAARCHGITAASSFYGHAIKGFLSEKPKCPIILHYGERDPFVPPEDVDAIEQGLPDIRLFRYDAGHGFFSDRAGAMGGGDERFVNGFDAEASALARRRTLQFFDNYDAVPD